MVDVLCLCGDNQSIDAQIFNGINIKYQTGINIPEDVFALRNQLVLQAAKPLHMDVSPKLFSSAPVSKQITSRAIPMYYLQLRIISEVPSEDFSPNRQPDPNEGSPMAAIYSTYIHTHKYTQSREIQRDPQ